MKRKKRREKSNSKRKSTKQTNRKPRKSRSPSREQKPNPKKRNRKSKVPKVPRKKKQKKERTPRKPTKKKSKPVERQEYVLNFDYGRRNKKKHHYIDVEVHVRGPKGKSDAEVKRIYEEWWQTGQAPKGWTFHLIKWRHNQKGIKQEGKPSKVREELSFVLSGQPKRIT